MGRGQGLYEQFLFIRSTLIIIIFCVCLLEIEFEGLELNLGGPSFLSLLLSWASSDPSDHGYTMTTMEVEPK